MPVLALCCVKLTGEGGFLTHEHICLRTCSSRTSGNVGAPRRNTIVALRVCRRAGITANEDQGNYVHYVRHSSDGHCESTHVFARVTPSSRNAPVKALKSQSEVVAMMGDGVNDASALKQAESGSPWASWAVRSPFMNSLFHTQPIGLEKHGSLHGGDWMIFMADRFTRDHTEADVPERPEDRHWEPKERERHG
jgi:hypothetical protein